MSYQEIFGLYEELKSLLQKKKEAIKSKNLDELAKIDEDCLVLNEQLKKYDLETLKAFSDDEKADLKALGQEIKVIEEHNEMLINHSLNVINNTLAGILNITQPDKCSYNAQGKTLGDIESLDISSITEEA